MVLGGSDHPAHDGERHAHDLRRIPVLAAPSRRGLLREVGDVAVQLAGAYNAEVTSVAKKLLEDALTLPEDERRRLGEAILDSLPAHAAEERLRAWFDEARRRAEDVERGEGETVDLDEALAQLRSDLRRRRG